MSSMENLISEYFAQNNVAPDFEQQAREEMFAKVAAVNGIDLESLEPEQIQYLWSETFKTASEDEPKEEKKPNPFAKKEEKSDEEKKAEAAYLEFEEKRAAAAKLAEAEYIGRFMAHAMTDEIKKIAAAQSAEVDLEEAKEAAAPGRMRRGAEALTEGVSAARKAIADHGSDAHKAIAHAAEDARSAAPAAKKGMSNLKKGLIAGGTTAAVGGGATATALGVHHHNKGKKKKASALDELAAEYAVEKAASVGWDGEEAAERIGAVLTLGVGESEKVASAADLESAVEVRSLELLEMAGYPVQWPSAE